jgi:hypothetical protein
MPGTSEQWSALDRQNERLVDAGSRPVPAVSQPDSRSPDGTEASQNSGAGRDSGHGTGPHRAGSRAAAAAVAVAVAAGRFRVHAGGRRPSPLAGS